MSTDADLAAQIGSARYFDLVDHEKVSYTNNKCGWGGLRVEVGWLPR